MYIKLKCVSFLLKHVSPYTSAGTAGRLYREHDKIKILTRYFSAQFLPALGLPLLPVGEVGVTIHLKWRKYKNFEVIVWYL
jgi:hypothetical protein